MKTGVVLLNFGGPWTTADVKPFLYRLFVNPQVLVGVPTPLRQLLAFVISQIKGPSSIKSYQSIGGGSPQLKWTAIQAAGLRALLVKDSVQVEIGMRSAEPSIQAALEELQCWGADELVLLPLFPQFSSTTTGTCFAEVDRMLRKMCWRPKIRKVANWPDQREFTALLRSMLAPVLARADAECNGFPDTVHVIFSAHSLPMKIVNMGDPYPNDVKRVVVLPISFVSDHIETLFELDQLYAELARSHGITHYYRAPCFNDNPEFPRVLHSILAE